MLEEILCTFVQRIQGWDTIYQHFEIHIPTNHFIMVLSIRTLPMLEEESRTCWSRANWRRSRRHDIGKQAAFCTMVMLPRTMLIPGSLFLWRVRIMGLFIRSPLVTEVSYVQWSWFIHFSWLIPPCRFHIHHISVLYRLQSYSTLMDFFSVALLISLVSWVYVTDRRWIIRSSHYAVFFFRDWLFCSDTLSVFLLARMFHPCHGSFFFSNKYRCSCSLLRQNNYLIS